MNYASTSLKAAAVALFLLLGAVGTHSADNPAQRGTKLYGDADRGRILFSTWCVSCHADSPHATDQVPTVRQLAAAPTRTDDFIRGFLTQPHRPMPPLALENQQIEDIIAYLHGLNAAAAVPAPPAHP